MQNKKISVVFFGSGPVAAASLEGILDEFTIELVVTKPLPLHHRGKAPVEELAKEHNLDIRFANSKKDMGLIFQDIEVKSTVGLIIDYGVILPSSVIDKFPKGVVNSHFSLLPRWRGPDPITYCLLAGDQQTGVSLMKIVPRLEEGPIIVQEKFILPAKINMPDLTRELVKLSNSMIKKYLPAYLKDELSPKPQSSVGITYSHKIYKSNGLIDWNKPAEDIEREIRAYAGWPKSRTSINGLDCIIIAADVSEQSDKSGKYQISDKNLLIFAGKGSLIVNKIQPAGKKPMNIEEFLRGYSSRLKTED